MDASKRTEDLNFNELMDMRHPPVFSRFKIANAKEIKVGQVVKYNPDTKDISGAATGETFLGIAVNQGTGNTAGVFINILIHGTVKVSNVSVNDTAPTDTDVLALNKIGIYCLN